MTASPLSSVWPDFRTSPPASPDQLTHFQLSSGINLPIEYLEFLKTSNGGEGFIGRNYLVLDPIEKIVESNRNLNVEEYAPGLVVIGSDGGGEAIGFDRRGTAWPVVMVPLIPLDMKEAQVIAESFGSFLDKYSRFEL